METHSTAYADRRSGTFSFGIVALAVLACLTLSVREGEGGGNSGGTIVRPKDPPGERKEPTDGAAAPNAAAAQPTLDNSTTQTATSLAPLSAPQNGGMDQGQRQSVNDASAKLMELGAEKDKLLEDGSINLKYWMLMSQGMTKAFNKGMSKGKQSGGSGGVDYQGANSGAGNDAVSSAVAPKGYQPPADSLVIDPSGGASRSLGSNDSSGQNETPAQVVNLSGGIPVVIPSSAPAAQDSFSTKGVGGDPKIEFNEKARHSDTGPSGSVAAQMVGRGALAPEKADGPELTDTQKALLKLQSAAFKQAAKSIADRKKAQGGDEAERPFQKTEAASQGAIANLRQDLKTHNFRPTKGGAQESESDVNADAAAAISRGLASSSNSVPSRSGTAFQTNEEDPTLLYLLALLGGAVGAWLVYRYLPRPRKLAFQLLVPNDGEHFSVREGSAEGEYLLDIKDVRGNLLRTVGSLRSHSVVRAAVLPPELAAKLGASGSFDRFEYIKGQGFAPTEKEEGYQIFPFVNEADKKSA